MRRFQTLVFASLALCASAGFATAEKRVALVIGNSAYQYAPRLSNPASDADAVAILFRSLGFDVVKTLHDIGIGDMRRAISDFADTTQNADIAVVYYAGHGIEVDGNNYLVPVDAKLRRDIDADDDAVSLDRILKIIEPARRLRLIILDACRENPFIKNMKRTIAKRALGRGLASVEPVSSDTLVAFAAKASSTADDGEGPHSPFTMALLRRLSTPGLDVRLAFGQVRDDVLKATGNRQEPFVYGSLGGGIITLASLSVDERTDARVVDPNIVIARDYEAALKIGTKAAIDAFLKLYPTGFYADLARAQRAKLEETRPSLSGSTTQPKLLGKTANLPAETSRPDTGRREKRTAQDKLGCCVAYWERRQGGRIPEGQSTSCLNSQTGYFDKPCVKSRSDITSMCHNISIDYCSRISSRSSRSR